VLERWYTCSVACCVLSGEMRACGVQQAHARRQGCLLICKCLHTLAICTHQLNLPCSVVLPQMLHYCWFRLL